MSKKSFMRLFRAPSLTIASNFQKAGSGKVEKGRVIHLVWSRDDDIPEEQAAVSTTGRRVTRGLPGTGA